MADLKTTVTDRWESTLSSALASGATTINVADTTGTPAVPFRVVIDPGNDAKYEEVLVDAGKTATTFTLTSATSRGQGISSDIAHDSGAVIAIVPVANHINDLHDRVDARATALTSHEGAADPHPGYVTDADLTAHEGAADPHPVYLTSAEGNAAYVAVGNATSLLASAEATTNQTGITTQTAITGLSVNFTLAAATNVRFTHYVSELQGTNVGDVATLTIDLDSGGGYTQVQSRTAHVSRTSGFGGGEMTVTESLSAGTYTARVQLVRSSGTGSVSHIASSFAPAQLTAERVKAA